MEILLRKIEHNLPQEEEYDIVDASGCVVTPCFVNTHHHFYQMLTRNIPAIQNAKLFDWFIYLYELWKKLSTTHNYLQ